MPRLCPDYATTMPRRCHNYATTIHHNYIPTIHTPQLYTTSPSKLKVRTPQLYTDYPPTRTRSPCNLPHTLRLRMFLITRMPLRWDCPQSNTCNLYFCQGTHERIASMFSHAVDPDPSPAIPQVPTHPHPSPPIPTHPHPSPYGLVQKSGGGGGGGASPKSGAGARAAAAAAKPRSSSGKNLTAFLRQLV